MKRKLFHKADVLFSLMNTPEFKILLTNIAETKDKIILETLKDYEKKKAPPRS